MPKWILGNDFVCDRWSKFENLLQQVSIINGDSNSVLLEENVGDILNDIKTKVKNICSILKKCIENLEAISGEGDHSRFLKKLIFLKDQLELSISSRPSYSMNFFLWASSIPFQFPDCYRLLRESNVLTLPHQKYLSTITSDIKSSVGIKDSQVEFFKKKFQHLEPHEKIINILFDEIHVKPKMEYRGSRLIGTTDRNEIATKNQTFRLTSILLKKSRRCSSISC